MRVSYSDEEDFPGQFELWHANCWRSIKGKKGQIALRELEQALLSLPEKRLIADALETGNDVCAIGALARRQQADTTDLQQQLDDCAIDMEDIGEEMGMPRLVAWKVVALNDESFNTYRDAETGQWKDATPEDRYRLMLQWVQKQIRLAPAQEERE